MTVKIILVGKLYEEDIELPFNDFKYSINEYRVKHPDVKKKTYSISNNRQSFAGKPGINLDNIDPMSADFDEIYKILPRKYNYDIPKKDEESYTHIRETYLKYEKLRKNYELDVDTTGMHKRIIEAKKKEEEFEKQWKGGEINKSDVTLTLQKGFTGGVGNLGMFPAHYSAAFYKINLAANDTIYLDYDTDFHYEYAASKVLVSYLISGGYSNGKHYYNQYEQYDVSFIDVDRNTLKVIVDCIDERELKKSDNLMQLDAMDIVQWTDTVIRLVMPSVSRKYNG